MDGFSPEFSGYWLGEHHEAPEPARPLVPATEEVLSPAQKAALEALAGLVNAARSVV